MPFLGGVDEGGVEGEEVDCGEADGGGEGFGGVAVETLGKSLAEESDKV